MNRPIKFRIWGKREGIFIGPDSYIGYQHGLETREGVLYRSNIHESHAVCDWSNFVKLKANISDTWYVTEQYTGLLDDQGKEIYEGDIILEKWDENQPYGYMPDKFDKREQRYTVIYQAPSFVFKGPQSCQQICVEDFTREVIGNIHENPELLKKKIEKNRNKYGG